MSVGRTGYLEVPRTARYHVLGPPSAEGVREVWFVLHGYRQLAGRFLRRFHLLDDGTRLVVAPEGLSRFYVEKVTRRHGSGSVTGASWMTRDEREREIADYVRYLDLLGERMFASAAGAAAAGDGVVTAVHREDVRLTVLGFSQGVATAARWAVLGSWPPDRLVLWGDTLPPDLPSAVAAERLRDVELVSVRGKEDETRRPDAEAEEEDRLEAWGVEREVRLHPGGHRVEEAPLAALL